MGDDAGLGAAVRRRDLVRHIELHGCRLAREGGRHSIYLNPRTMQTSAVPRHRELNLFTAQKICRDLGVPAPNIQ